MFKIIKEIIYKKSYIYLIYIKKSYIIYAYTEYTCVNICCIMDILYIQRYTYNMKYI